MALPIDPSVLSSLTFRVADVVSAQTQKADAGAAAVIGAMASSISGASNVLGGAAVSALNTAVQQSQGQGSSR